MAKESKRKRYPKPLRENALDMNSPQQLSPVVLDVYEEFLKARSPEDVAFICRLQKDHPLSYRLDTTTKGSYKECVVFCKQWQQCDCKVAFIVDFNERKSEKDPPKVYVFAAEHSQLEQNEENKAPTRMAKAKLIEHMSKELQYSPYDYNAGDLRRALQRGFGKKKITPISYLDCYRFLNCSVQGKKHLESKREDVEEGEKPVRVPAEIREEEKKELLNEIERLQQIIREEGLSLPEETTERD